MTTEPTPPAPGEPTVASPPAPAAAPSPTFSKPVVVAGLLGGLLGAVLSFALGRVLPAPVKPPPPAAPSEARGYAEFGLSKLKEGKHDEFMEFLRPAYLQAPPEEFARVRAGLIKAHEENVVAYGPGGDFEFCDETQLSPTAVRVSFLEKYQRGCVTWTFVVYKGQAGWLVVSCRVYPSASGFPTVK
jgi:hypothetical protein